MNTTPNAVIDYLHLDMSQDDEHILHELHDCGLSHQGHWRDGLRIDFSPAYVVVDGTHKYTHKAFLKWLRANEEGNRNVKH